MGDGWLEREVEESLGCEKGPDGIGVKVVGEGRECAVNL
jgi:hypothetical protein